MKNAKTLTDFERFILDWLGYEPSDEDYTREEVRTFIDFHADEELNEVIQEYLTKS